MKRTHRIAAIAFREARKFVAIAAARAARTDHAKTARSVPSFRALTNFEAEVILGVELLATLKGARRQ